VPQVAYRSCSGAVRVTDRAGVRRLSLRPRTDLRPIIQVCRLMVLIPVIHVITWFTSHLQTLQGWKAELAWLVDRWLADTIPTKWSRVNHRSGV